MEDSCVFCKIVRGDSPSHRVWEDDQHLAFLSIYPGTPGFTVMVTKQHYPSDAMQLPDDVLSTLILAVKAVSARLVRALDGVGRCAVVFEGFGVDHIHAKVIPLHGTEMDTWRPVLASDARFSDSYEGFVDTRDGPRAPDDELGELAALIRNTKLA